MRIPSVASRPGPLARAPPRAPARVATSSPRDCCVTISAVHRVRGFARARVATTTRSRSRRRRIERQKNVRLAIVERGAYLGRPRALNHSLVIHHVRHHGPVRRRRANARRAVTSWMGGMMGRGGAMGAGAGGAGRTLRELRSTPPHVHFARSHAAPCPRATPTRATAALAASHHISVASRTRTGPASVMDTGGVTYPCRISPGWTR